MIFEHSINPYPRKLWVATNVSFDTVKEDFKFDSVEDESLTNKYINEHYDAVMFTVSHNNNKGYLLFITPTVNIFILSHEALHVALCIFEDCNMILSVGMDQEPLCYLQEYLFKIITGDYINSLPNKYITINNSDIDE